MRFENRPVRLQDICDELSDGLHKAPVFVKGGEYLFVNATNLESGRIVDKDTEKHTSYEEFLKYGVKLNDRTILYSIDGTIGNIARYHGEKCVLGKGACYINVIPSVDVNYIYYLLQSPDFNSYIHNMSTGSTIRHISLRTMRNYEFSLPTIDIQKKISSILRAIDDKIELNNKINENLHQRAHAVISQYCESTSEYIELGDILQFVNGYAFKSKEYTSAGKYRVVTIKNVQDGVVDSSGAAYMNTLPSKMKGECFLSRGDVLLSLTGNVGRVGIVSEENLLLNQRVAKFKPIKKEMIPFLYYYFRMPSTKILLESVAKGTAQQNLSPVETLKLKIPFENKSANDLSRSLQPLFDRQVVGQIESTHLAQIRDTLLPKLMNGEIDLDGI